MTESLQDHVSRLLGDEGSRLIGQWHEASNIDSTNSWALRSELPAAGIAVFLADSQSAGRGRRGRQWLSPPGSNLYLTLARRWMAPPAALGPLGIHAGLAATEALHDLEFDTVRLKWPNDLLAGDRKLGGLLVELQGNRLVLGIGINVALPADLDPGQPATDLATLGPVPTRAALLARILARLLPRLANPPPRLEEAELERWQAVDALAGRDITVHTGGTTMPGRVIGLAPDGALRVAHPAGECRHMAGEVSLRGH